MILFLHLILYECNTNYFDLNVHLFDFIAHTHQQSFYISTLMFLGPWYFMCISDS